MRIRHKPYARSELAAWPRHINEPEAARGQWKDCFANPGLPLRLELGCGKGSFLAAQALAHPHHNFLGIDMKSEVLVVGKRNIECAFGEAGKEPANIAITPFDIERIHQLFSEEDAIERIYINFCNPWYKSGHAKHRLTHPRQLLQYRHFLRPDAEIYFKTDDDRLYIDSLRYFALCGFMLQWESRNLHREEPAWNIRTEHERMFSEQGIPIKACIQKMGALELDESLLRRARNI